MTLIPADVIISQLKIERGARRKAVLGVFHQGIVNEQEILKYLNFDESGKKIGDFTVEEIRKVLPPKKKRPLRKKRPPRRQRLLENQDTMLARNKIAKALRNTRKT